MIKKLFLKTISVGLGAAALGFGGATTVLTQARTPQQPDNTSANKQPGAPTADQQKETAADRELAQKIRKSIMDDKSLSTYAHNVKVIVRDGTVTLKGPVQSEDEKKNIGSKAADAAGAGKVQNQLTVKS